MLVNQTKALSKDHLTLSEIYTTHLVARLQTVIEDVQRIYKKCREIGYETHEEILRVLQELHTTMKTYHSYQVNKIGFLCSESIKIMFLNCEFQRRNAKLLKQNYAQPKHSA